MGSRLVGIIVKEFIHLKRDMLALVLALVVPVAMLFIFGWAINTDVKHVRTAVFDQSGSAEARSFLEAMGNSQYFDVLYYTGSHRELTRLIDEGTAKVGVVIPPDFGRRISRQAADIQVIVDASDPLVATSAVNAAAALGAQRSLQMITRTLEGAAISRTGDPPLDVRVRAWYNPDLVSAIFIVPGLVFMGMANNSFLNTSSSLFITKLQGTVVDLLAAPLGPTELLLGFIGGGMVRGLVVGLLTWAVAAAFTGFRLVHVLPTLGFLLIVSYVFSMLGFLTGLWAEKFEQINFFPIFVMLPLTFLGGVFYSVEALPEPWHSISLFNPMVHMVEGLRYGMLGSSSLSPALGGCILGVVAVVATAIAFAALRSGYKLRV